MASLNWLAKPLAALVAVSVLAAAPGAPVVESDVAVRMRDGVVLRADVWRPAQDDRYPTLVYRTPYDRRRALETSPLFRRAVERGYAVVAQDVRGRYGSEGEFEPYRNEGRDGYDTIEWAAAQPWSNGAVGTFGLSYPGAVQWLAAVESPPHLEAMAPAMTFSTPENFFYAGGAFDLSWIDWIWLNIAPDARARKGLAGARTPREAQAGWDRLGPELRGRLPLDALAELREVAPYYFEWLAHPPGDPWWEWSELRGKYGRVKAAVLNLSGWHDEAYGPEGALTNHLGLLAARAGTTDARTALVLGPWVHGGVESDRAGERVFGEAARLDYPELVLRFMDRHVRKLDVDTGKPVRAFVMGENTWREADSWPLPGTETLQLYLAPGGGLSQTPLANAEASSVLVSDPARPLVDPYSHVLGAHDYRELARRPEVLVFETPPLTEDLRVVGTIQAEVFLASDAPDADLWLKLLDVAPDGTALNLMSPGLELQRAGFREGGPQRKPLRPGEVAVLRFPRLMTGNLFPRGHRVRVVLSGSFMPHFSRNLQTGESEATSSTTRAATLRIHHDAAHPSRLALPVVADAPLSGFSPAAAREQRELERRLVARISTRSLDDYHRTLTRRPHVAGTEGGLSVARAIETALGGMGLRAERREYEAHLSYPRRIRVALTRPLALELPSAEREDARDPDSAHPELLPGFVAYSASGRVRGRVVYANYGLPADYAALAAAGVSVADTVPLVRYGKVHRAVKVFGAESRGARGILIYSDPADDGDAKGRAWPDGPWRAPWFLQRGNAKYSWHWHGDPLTPLRAATPGAARLDPGTAPTLPRILAAVLSAEAAREILERLAGPEAPPGFRGGLPVEYRTGPGPGEVELDVAMEAGPRPIVNVLARFEGAQEPDRVVLLGTHHDAWTFGGVDPGGSSAAILELARALSELAREGWRPRRTLQLAFWDAEEFGLIGSTEYAEQEAGALRERAVAYLNSDLYRAGELEARGTAALGRFAAELARDVARPRDAGSLAGDLDAELPPLGSGADFVPFQMLLGLPSLSLEFGPLGGYGSYHSAYDTRRYMERFGDPGWSHGRALVELLGRAALRLANAEVLPLQPSATARTVRRALESLEAPAGAPATLGAELDAFEREAAELETAATARLQASDLPDGPTRRRLNDALARAEKAFADADPADSDEAATWYRHALYGWDIYALYAGDTLPGLRRALARGDGAGYERERARLARMLAGVAQDLSQARAALSSPGAR